MPAENIEIVRRVNEAISDGDMERILALIHHDFETAVGPELSLEPDVYRGHDGIRRYFESFGEAMDEIRFQPVDLREADLAVVVDLRLSATGRFTGISVEQRLGQVWTLQDGKAIRVRSYVSYQDALRAVGLDE